MRIFYSWQSDIPEHRKVIEKALRNVKIIIPEIEIITATSDKTGAFRIDNNIIEKIESADLYLADLSIIGNLGKRRRQSPNPNVIYETGFAHGVLTEEKMYMLAQKIKSGTDKFPFDIRNRHLALYDFNSTEILKELTDDFKNFIKKSTKKQVAHSIDMYVQVSSISGDGSMNFEITNEEDAPYNIESASIDGHKTEINRFLKGKDTAYVSVKFSDYPFAIKPENFSLVFSRNKKRFQTRQLVESEARADGMYNLTRIIPVIENCVEI